MTDYNVMLDLARIDPETFDLTPFEVYGGALVATAVGTRELVLTVPAHNISQAITTAYNAFWEAHRFEPYIVRAMSTAAFDAGLDLPSTPETMSVGEAASRLGVTASAVRQRLSAGTLPGARVGRDWRIPTQVVDAAADDTRIRWTQIDDDHYVGESGAGRYEVVRRPGGWVTRYPGHMQREAGHERTPDESKRFAEDHAFRSALDD